MKKISKLFMMLFVLFSLVIFGSTTVKAASDTGLTFEEYNRYVINKPFEELPYTIEMEVKIDKGLTGNSGTIFGNMDWVVYGSTVGHGRLLNIDSIDGVVRLLFTNKYNQREEIKFDGVDVRTGDWVHLTVAFDKTNNKAHLYMNGELVSSKAVVADFTHLITETKYHIGGDNRTLNPAWFKGECRELAVYSDLRTAAEIESDYSNGVNLKDANLLAQYGVSSADVHKDLTDNSGNGYWARYEDTWYDNQEIEMDYAYSFAAVGDTQMLNFWGQDSDMNTLYKWIVDNVQTQKIQHVFGLGDITETWGKDTPEEEYEWQRAKDAIYQMNGKVSYSLVRGNHDESGFMNEYLNEDIYKSQFGGFYDDGTINSSWKTLKVGNVDFLLIGLDYGASDAELEWAGSIVEAHPNHKVIVTTHGYLEQEGNRMGADYPHSPCDASDYDNDANYNHGEGIWQKFVSKYENIFLVMSGHINDEDVVYRQDYGVHGNVVTQILIDFQDVDKQLVSAKGQSAAGIVTMLYMNEDCSEVEIACYSTIRDKFYKKYNHITIDLNGECNEKHTLEYKNNDYKHWQECACGYKTEEVYHDYKNHTSTTQGTKEGTCVCGLTKEFSNTTNAVALELQSLLERYYNNGSYIKDTTIYIDKTKLGDELANYFHANVDLLERKTYYDGNKLWMLAGSDYSGYGTSADGHLTTFRVSLDNVVGKETVISSLPGMEEYYCTLLDLILGQHTSAHTGNKSLNLNDGWAYENGVYSNTSADVLDAFRLFTAPAWIGKNATNSNYVTYTKATIELSGGHLVLKLWVSSENKGSFADNYANVDSEGNYLFSEAIISEYYWKENVSSNLHGSGTEENPYLITNTADLMHLQEFASLYAGKYVKLMTDIDLKGKNFIIESFAGTFDGNGHKISGLAIDTVSANTGLFRTLEAGGVIKNLSVDGSVRGVGIIGAIVGTSNGVIENCKNYATVTGNGQRGGIVGISKGSITNCHNYGEVVTLISGWNVGGIVGESSGNITNCTNNATVYGLTTHVGGVVGSLLSGDVTNCNNYALVSGYSWGAGGIIGYVNNTASKITGCVNEGLIENGKGQVGGIVGKAKGTISNCINKANLNISSGIVGGIVGDGYATTTIISCENHGAINATSEKIGGIIGQLQGGSVKDSINYATVKGSTGAVGGVVGLSKGTVQNCVNDAKATVSGGEWSVAGIVGHSEGNVISCKNFAAVTGTKGGVAGVVGELVKDLNIKVENSENHGVVTGLQFTGGIVGYLRNNSVVNCVNKGAVTATGTKIGGIAGGSDVTGASITGSKNYGSIKGGQHTAGIVGQMQGSVKDCTNYGSITSTSSESASIIGKLYVAATTPTTVDNCVNYGTVKAAGYFGGLFGNAANATITNCINYGNLETTGQAVGAIISYIFSGGNLVNCYNYGTIKAKTNIAGVVYNNNGSVSNCYNYGSLTATDASAVVNNVCIVNSGTITGCEKAAAAVWDGTSVSTSLAGSGTAADPYLITSGADLAYIASVVKAHTEHTVSGGSGSRYLVYSNKYFKLSNDINLNGNSLIIGSYSAWNNYSVFDGILLGNNNSIIGMNVSASARGAGLFGGIGKNGVIKDLTLYGNVNSTADTVGGLTGWLGGKLENCVSYVNVTGTSTVGGLVGNAETNSSVINCVNYGKVTGSSYIVGGVAGAGKSTFTNCMNYGTISSTSTNVGGVIGSGTNQDKTSIYTNCVNYGNVTGSSTVGGFASKIHHSAVDCVNYGTITGASSVSGIVATLADNAAIANCDDFGKVVISK